MNEPSTSPGPGSGFVDALASVGGGVAAVPWSRYLSWAGAVLALPLRLVWVPVRFLAAVVLGLLAPVLHMLSYALSWVAAIYAFFAGLEPLYTFFGTAASVGIVAGIVLSMSSSLITTRLGMQDDEQEFPEKTYRPGSAYTHEESSSNEADWAWLSEAASSSRRRAASGLLSQTIHEEDDDSQDES